MTRVTLFRSGGKIVGFDAKGHTGYAQEGSDIVCSAVSALTQTAILGLTQVAGISPDVQVKEALLKCRLPDKISEQQSEEARLILETMAVGLSSIAGDYGEYISITERKV